MASEKETMPKESDKNGQKNGAETNNDEKEKLSLGEIAAVDEEIAKAKTDQLQLLHNLIYDKNGTGPQIKRNIRKFAGFDKGERQKKLDQLTKSEEASIKQTAVILALETGKEDAKEKICEAIVDFLITPSGKTIEEVEQENPQEDEESAEEEEEKVEVKPKSKGGRGSTAGRPKRATTSSASKVWTEDFESSEGEEIEEALPRVGRKKKRDDSDSGSDYNPSAGSDSEADRRKSSRAVPSGRPARGARGKRRNVSDSEEEESEESEEDFSEEELPKKKKATPARAPPRRGAAQRGRKRKQESESEDEPSESEEEEDEELDSEEEKQKKLKATKVSDQKNSKGRPKRPVPPAKKKKKDASSDEDDDGGESEEEEDDEPLKKPPKGTSKKEDDEPSDDEIKKLLKDILAEANLEEITMKTVCKKVYAHYPNHDLSARKDFIKQTVKSLIAA